MKRSPIKRRVRDLYKIWDHRSEILENAGSAVDREPASNQIIGFSYTKPERSAIADKLVGDADIPANSLDDSIDQIETLVRLTLQAHAHRKRYPISDELQKQLRALDKPIEQILTVLNEPELEHLKEFVPNLRTELSMLLRMVRTDQRGRGRPPDPAIILNLALVTRLAEVWSRHQGGWPKRWYSDELGRDWGPFYRFHEACLKPADLQVRDYVIRKALNIGVK